jgi:uncharacterized membrane protein YdfJ with MMPL/SSD domain
VIFSGITVGIGLLALMAMPLTFLRSIGHGGALIPLVSTLVAITLLPVVLAKAGPPLDWPHRRTDENASRAWTPYGSFPLMVALIAITTFVLLARACRSLLLPAKAIVLNVLSVAAACGVMALVWQHGHGSEAIWDIQATGSIPSWIPLMVFAFLSASQWTTRR